MHVQLKEERQEIAEQCSSLSANVKASSAAKAAAKVDALKPESIWQVKPDLITLFRRYLRFGIVGASGIGVDMAALFVLADPKMLHLGLSLSKALAAEIAILSNFALNEYWTFSDLAAADSSWRGRASRFGKFNLICIAGIGLSVFLLNIQTRFLGINMYLANLIAILIVSAWNFGMNLKFGWKP